MKKLLRKIILFFRDTDLLLVYGKRCPEIPKVVVPEDYSHAVILFSTYLKCELKALADSCGHPRVVMPISRTISGKTVVSDEEVDIFAILDEAASMVKKKEKKIDSLEIVLGMERDWQKSQHLYARRLPKTEAFEESWHVSMEQKSDVRMRP